MDQTETAGGCYAGAELATRLGDTTTANRAATIGNTMFAGMTALWNPATPLAPAYDWAVAGDGTHDITNWNNYLHGLQQVWVVVFGISDPARSNSLMTQFLTSQPSWADQSITGRYDALIAVALQRIGQQTQAAAGLYTFEARSQANSREFDWNPAHAGWAVTAQLQAGDLLYNIYSQRVVSSAVSRTLNSGHNWVAISTKVKKTDGSWVVV